MDSQQFRANRPKVIFEAFEDETVLINLDSGTYYSFAGSAAFIWNKITNGETARSTTAFLQERYPDGGSEIEQSVGLFVQQLVEENLIVPADASAAGSVAGEGNLEPAPALSSEFQRPVLNKYSDMQELLLLDPIHEVDESGWPHVLPTAPTLPQR